MFLSFSVFFSFLVPLCTLLLALEMLTFAQPDMKFSDCLRGCSALLEKMVAQSATAWGWAAVFPSFQNLPIPNSSAWRSPVLTLPPPCQLVGNRVFHLLWIHPGSCLWVILSYTPSSSSSTHHQPLYSQFLLLQLQNALMKLGVISLACLPNTHQGNTGRSRVPDQPQQNLLIDYFIKGGFLTPILAAPFTHTGAQMCWSLLLFLLNSMIKTSGNNSGKKNCL